jgi:hypothetical protein
MHRFEFRNLYLKGLELGVDALKRNYEQRKLEGAGSVGDNFYSCGGIVGGVRGGIAYTRVWQSTDLCCG